MKRREFLSLVGGASASLPRVAWAQSPDTTPVVGVFMPGPESDPGGSHMQLFCGKASKSMDGR
jgi:hypothetical protein